VVAVAKEENTPERGESLVVNKVLLKPAKEMAEPPQRKTLLRTMCKVQGKCCQMIIDSGSTDNLVSTEVVEKLKLKTMKHPTPYKVSWLEKGHQLLVSEQCKVEFQVGKYKDEIVCDVMPMDVCHILLGRPWQYDRGAINDGKRNTYKFGKDGINHTLLPLQEEDEPEQKTNSKTLLLGGKEYLKQRMDVQFGCTQLRAAELKVEVSIGETEEDIIDDFLSYWIDPDQLDNVADTFDVITGAEENVQSCEVATAQEEFLMVAEEVDQSVAWISEATVETVELYDFQTESLCVNTGTISDNGMLQQCHREIALFEYLLENP